MKNIVLKSFLKLFCLYVISLDVIAATLPTGAERAISDQQLIYQQERQKALQDSLSAPVPDVKLLPAIVKTHTIDFPIETPCFAINHVELRERDALPFTLPLYALSNQAEGQCLGGQGINLLMTELQNRIISYGYITTRVVAPEQDLTSGSLVLLLVKGTVSGLYYTDQSDNRSSLQSALPLKKGRLLNLRDIEQGLENLQRIPTVKAEMQLVPGEHPGESDIVINRTQSKYWRLGASFDDSGAKDTGHYQGGLTFYLDNPLGMSDAFYVSGVMT
ncbi:POTRA domain-containing protein [Orbus sturtevantii]